MTVAWLGQAERNAWRFGCDHAGLGVLFVQKRLLQVGALLNRE